MPIIQSVTFKSTTPTVLYKMYMDAKLHSQSIGAPVKISNKTGTEFSAHGDYIKGKNLHLVKDKLIVQTWRASDWKKKDLDSILVLSFEKDGKDAVVHLTHINVPENRVTGIEKGWYEFYWKLWKIYLSGKLK